MRLFTTDKPIIFAFHGYPVADSPADLSPAQSRQHSCTRLQGRRHDDDTVRHVRAERMDRFQLALDAVTACRGWHRRKDSAAVYTETMQRHKLYVSEHGEDMPEVANWRWRQ